MRILWLSLLIAICVISYVAGGGEQWPSEVRKCHFGDSNCLTNSAQQVVSTYGKTGIREMNLIPFDPLRVSLIKLDRNPASPVSVELIFKDVDLIGLQNSKVLKLTGFDREMKEHTELVAHIPDMLLKGPYSVNGQVLFLPIVGKGNCEILLKNLQIVLKVKNRLVQKSGQTYMEVEAIKLEMKPEKVTFHLEGLFNGNKELADTMDQFINENWLEIFTELQPDMSRALGLILKKILNNIFEKHPYEQYFLQDSN